MLLLLLLPRCALSREQGFISYMHRYALFQAMGLVGSIIMSASQRCGDRCAQQAAPHVSAHLLSLLCCALCGLRPHNMYLHSALVQSRAIDRSRGCSRA